MIEYNLFQNKLSKIIFGLNLTKSSYFWPVPKNKIGFFVTYETDIAAPFFNIFENFRMDNNQVCIHLSSIMFHGFL